MSASRLFSGFRTRLPLLLQTEAAECGLVCLAMIANYYGYEIDLPAMRRRFSTSVRGVTLARIVADAHSLDFDSRPLRIEVEYLPQLQTPCILHWNLNHFVVLKRATAGSVEIHDPGLGYRSLSMAEARKSFTGIALELQPAKSFQPIKEQQRISLRHLVGNFHGLKSAMVQVLFLAFGLELFALIIPLYMQLVLDQVLITTDTNFLTLLGIGFLFIVTFRAGLNVARGWAVSWVGGRLNSQWVSHLFSHLLRLPVTFFEKRHVGDVTSRFNSVQIIQQTLTGSFIESILDGVMGSMALCFLMAYSISLTGLVFLSLVAYAACRWLAYRQLRQVNEEQIIYAARQQTSLLEAIRGVQTIKLANKQSERAARFASITLHAVRRNVTLQRIGVIFASINQWLFSILRIVLIWIAATQVLAGKFSIGMLVAFIAYSDELTSRFGNLADKLIELYMLRLHTGRIADITLTKPEKIDWGKSHGIAHTVKVDVKNVSFRYSESEPWILRHCNFHVGAGESIAITGPSGCGKTTLAKIILGLLDPTEGVVCINGENIHSYGIEAYRELIGAVMQNDELFEGSIADNICFFDNAPVFSRIEDAAKKVVIHDEIKAMPMGYETFIGNMGTSLSGGQKQRMLLARAIYRDPKILVLDEATSHLDMTRERIINTNIGEMQMTRIIIAHRDETIALVDQVFAIPLNNKADTAIRN